MDRTGWSDRRNLHSSRTDHPVRAEQGSFATFYLPRSHPSSVRRGIHVVTHMPETFALESEDIRKTFGHFTALGGVTLSVKRGEFLTLFTLRVTPPSAVKDRKSTRLNSSHVRISYAVFCLKKKIDTPTDPCLSYI